MSKRALAVLGEKSFDDLKHLNQHGAEYWNARELQPMLGYSQWRRFEDAIKRAVISCEKSGNNPAYHFAGAGKMVDLGSGSQREVPDYQLSRFACYLIAQNGDPRKPEIANAQKYFAVQTRKQELSEAQAADLERLELRKQTSEEFKALSGAAHEAGVQSKMFGVFHDAGYKGLYGGLGNEAIKTRKGIPAKEQLMDRMGTTELAANQFRMTQTRDKLARERVKNQQQAIQTHEQVGKETYRRLRNSSILESAFMNSYQFTVVIEPDEDGFHAYVPALPGCHTFGSTLDEARANIAEAIELHVESLLGDGEPIPAEREPMFITRLSVPVVA